MSANVVGTCLLTELNSRQSVAAFIDVTVVTRLVLPAGCSYGLLPGCQRAIPEVQPVAGLEVWSCKKVLLGLF